MESDLAEVKQLMLERRFGDAFNKCREVLRNNPENPDVLLCFAELASVNRLYPLSVEYYQRAFFAGIEKNKAAYEYAAALNEAGRLVEAELEARTILRNDPTQAGWWNLLGVIYRRQKNIDLAIKSFNKAVEIDPLCGHAWFNLGNIYADLREGEKSVEKYLKAIEADPKNATFHRMLAFAYRLTKDQAKAFEHLEISKSLNKNDVNIYIDIAYAHLMINNMEEAYQITDEALALFGDAVPLLCLKGDCFVREGKLEEGLQWYQKAMEKERTNILPYRRAAYALLSPNREKANACLRQALTLAPTDPQIAAELCDSLNRSRYGKEADHIEEAYKLAVKITDNNKFLVPLALYLHGSLVRAVDFDRVKRLGSRDELMRYAVNNLQASMLHFQLSQMDTLEDRYKLLEFHRMWGQKIENLAKHNPITIPPRRKVRGEKIRIGFMSSDLRNHPVTYFVIPIIQYYDKSRFELYCYSYYPHDDDNTQTYIQKRVDVFRRNPGISDKDAAQIIANDELDILFDLGGSTDLNKINVMAYRAAPIQVSWLGYPNSCGLETIDYILVDPYINPPDQKLLIEKPFIMPETWVVMSPEGFGDVPIDPVIPELRKGYITFGTMNNPFKFTRRLMEIWAKVMQRVPGSHFIFVRPEGDVPSFRKNVVAEFGRMGISAERIEFIGIRAAHRPYYNAMDISLDTFPQTGGTTTCESIWMGVPCITLVGEAFFERLSYSNLMNAGLKECCAFSEEEYIQKAVALAENRLLRQNWHDNLRVMIRQSPLGQTKRFVENFQNVIEKTVRKELASAEV